MAGKPKTEKKTKVDKKLKIENESGLIEAILYLEMDPIDITALSHRSGLSRDMVKKALEYLEVKYQEDHSGVELSRIGGGVMLSTKQQYWDILKPHYGKKNELRFSKATLETLSIIAYSQPVTRSEIETIRGVQAVDTVMRFLLEKDLIRAMGKKDVPGKPIQYGTTRAFLRFFQLNSIADLPKLSESEAARFELDN